MKIAIIGAGISGLTCAYELVRNGIAPVIFEKNGFIGHQLEYSSIWPMNNKFTKIDLIKYLKNTFELEITPMEKLRTIEFSRHDKKKRIVGNLGYIMRRGKQCNSIEKQLASKLNIQIELDSYIKIEDIKDLFDIIVVATGNNLIAKQYNLWRDSNVSQVRVATVLGDFDTGSIKIWFNREYAQNALFYLVPNNPYEASLIMKVKGTHYHEVYYYWDTFLSKESIPYNITEVRDGELCFGAVKAQANKQIYFIGNAGGLTDKFMGEGDFNAILSGIYTAKAIMEKKS